jgi:SAM-dependent methyltransferase
VGVAVSEWEFAAVSSRIVHTRTMDGDELVRAHYSQSEEGRRLDETPHGVLERLRTWDLFERWLPAHGVVYDIGGGAGVHSAWLADRGYVVELFDLVPGHVAEAAAASRARSRGRRFVVEQGDARRIPRGDGSADVVLLLGPLYHLVETSERRRALIEARRLLKPGGLLVAAGISRFAWLMDAYRKGVAGSAEVQASITYNVRTGRSNADPAPGVFWAYFHRPDELTDEITAAGFENVSVAGVEGFAWMLPDLNAILDRPASAEALLGQLRTVESEPSIVGSSAHLLAHGVKPV